MRVGGFLIMCCVWGLVFSGCVGGVVALSYEESQKYENAYLNALEKGSLTERKPVTKMIQPNNKKEDCKVLVGIDENDKTLKSDYRLYWDGECKDGFAFGLGREIEMTNTSYLQQIGIYKKGQTEDYCVFFDRSNANRLVKFEGLCGEKTVGMQTNMSEQNGELDIKMAFITSSNYQKQPTYTMMVSPFFAGKIFIKSYPNFSYKFTEYSSIYDILAFSFETLNGFGNLNGISLYATKEKVVSSGEFHNGKLVRSVSLPQSYLEHIQSVYDEIVVSSQKALQFQEKASNIKEAYKRKICRSNVKVTFMDNKNYKEICNEKQQEDKLREKINAKVAKINAEKEKQWLQIQKQKEIEAIQRMAEAEESANTQRALNNLNQSIQIMNQNLQMQTNQAMQQTNQSLQNYYFNRGQQNIQNSLDSINNKLHRMKMGL